MGMMYGYARCSTDETRQDINRQKRELKKLGVETDSCIYWEYQSGVSNHRPELQKLIDIVKPGDSIVCTEVSRLTRSTKQLCELLQIIQEKHVSLIIGTFIVDCRATELDTMTKGMLLMWGVFAELERDMISQRVKSGMQNAKLKGKRIGRPHTDISKLPCKFLQFYPEYVAKKISLSDLARVCGRSRTTIYSYIKLMKQQHQ